MHLYLQGFWGMILAIGFSFSQTETGGRIQGEKPWIVAASKKRPGRRTPPRKPQPKPKDPEPTPAPTSDEPAASSVPTSTGEGAARSSNRIDFDAMHIKGQTTKAGEVQILERKDTELKSMVKRRTSFREEIIQTVFPEKSL
jgi:hypothetical protein